MNAAVTVLGPTGDELMNKVLQGYGRQWRPRDEGPHTACPRRVLCSAPCEQDTCLRGRVAAAPAVPVHSVLTHADRGLSRPLVVLQTYPDGGAHQPEARAALIHHSVPVTEAVPADVTVHDGVRGPAVASYKRKQSQEQHWRCYSVFHKSSALKTCRQVSNSPGCKI